MEEKELCRARIEGGFTRKTKTIFWIVYLVFFIGGFFIGTCRDEFFNGTIYYDVHWYGVFFFVIAFEPEFYFELDEESLFCILGFIPLIFPIWRALVSKNCSKCTLALTTEKIYGAHKWFLKNEQILMPMSKIDNIIVRYNFIDRLYGGGGRTVRIASNSGFVNFPCVQNAEDFADLAMEQLEKYRKSQNTAAPAPDSSIVDKLQSLQALKEQGILSEEEFNAKKAELLSKM